MIKCHDVKSHNLDTHAKLVQKLVFNCTEKTIYYKEDETCVD